jgi:hypothetical protein
MFLVAIVVGGPLLACTGLPMGGGPELSGELKESCFDWPDKEFSKQNRAKPLTFFEKGDQAVDFTLKTVDGEAVTLSELLATKPVLLMAGNWTCPRYQENRSKNTRLADQFSDEIHTVLVYNMEAHPKGVVSPYRGKVWEESFSDRRQHRTYDERVDSARSLSVGSNETLLVDGLGDGNTNPFWCTYGTCPSCSFLIGMDGKFEAVHKWHDPPTMTQSIKALVGS